MLKKLIHGQFYQKEDFKVHMLKMRQEEKDR